MLAKVRLNFSLKLDNFLGSSLMNGWFSILAFISDRKLSVSVCISVLVSLHLSVSAEISVLNQTENRNLWVLSFNSFLVERTQQTIKQFLA